MIKSTNPNNQKSFNYQVKKDEKYSKKNACNDPLKIYKCLCLV